MSREGVIAAVHVEAGKLLDATRATGPRPATETQADAELVQLATRAILASRKLRRALAGVPR